MGWPVGCPVGCAVGLGVGAEVVGDTVGAMHVGYSNVFPTVAAWESKFIVVLVNAHNDDGISPLSEF